MTAPPRRMLAVKIADIGDLLLTTPALAALRAAYPEARIDILTTAHAAPILEGTGLVDEVVVFGVKDFARLRDLLRPPALREGWRLIRQLRAARYDTVLVFHQLTTRFGALKQLLILLAAGAPRRVGLDNGRGWFFTDRVPDLGFGAKHQAEYWLDMAALLGAKPADRRLHVGVSEADRQWAREQLPDGPTYVAIHPGSGGFNLARRWEPEKFAAVADALASRGATVVLVGGPEDDADSVRQHMQHMPINLAGKTTLGQLAALLARCAAYIGGDSGVSHLAGATPGLAVHTLFGPTNHLAWRPWTTDTSTFSVIRSGVLCSPCGYVGHSIGLRSGCEARTCMKLLTPEDVLGVGPDAASNRARLDLIIRQREAPPALHLLGIPIDALTFDELLDRIAGWIGGKVPRLIATANPELVMIAQRDVLFFSILNRADVVTADGVGLLWAARRLGHPLPERVTGSDSLPIIAERAAREGWRLFLLGAAPGVAARAAQLLQERYPGLQVAGTFAGSPSAAEEDTIVAVVNASRADILFVAYGSPAQEKWIARNLPRLKVGVVMGIGGALDFAAGVARRAPPWMRRLGIEWLHRLLRQPWRWRRMLRLPRFVVTVLWRGERGPAPFVGTR